MILIVQINRESLRIIGSSLEHAEYIIEGLCEFTDDDTWTFQVLPNGDIIIDGPTYQVPNYAINFVRGYFGIPHVKTATHVAENAYRDGQRWRTVSNDK